MRVVPITCLECGQQFLVPPNKRASARYCSRACLSRASAKHNAANFKGERNPRWRGGRALSYGPNWKKIKALVRERDEVCRQCGKTPAENGRALDVHHLNPFRFSGDNSLENLIALCRSCHMRADDHGRAGSARFLKTPRVKLPSRREIRALEQRARAGHTRDRRESNKLRAFALSAEGRSLREVAGALGVSHQTVANWLGGVHDEAPDYDAAA